MRKRRTSLVKHLMFVALVVMSIVGLTGWSMDCHNKRRAQFGRERREQEIRVETEQDAADRAAGIAPIEELAKEEYE